MSTIRHFETCILKFYYNVNIQNSLEEIEHDANCIVSLLEATGSEFSGVVKKLDSSDTAEITQWIIESLDFIYKGEGPPEKDNQKSIKILGASDEACMVTAVISQWITRFMCKKLIQLMTPEAAILKRK